MNRDELRGRIEHEKEKLERVKKEIKKVLKRTAFVADEKNVDMKTIEFLKEELDRLEGLVSKRIILEGEIQKLIGAYKNMPEENI